MKDIKQVINEASGNSIPWSASAAIIYTMWLIATDGDATYNVKRNTITNILNIFPNETVNRVYDLIKKMYQGEEKIYKENFVDILGEMALVTQTKGIKY